MARNKETPLPVEKLRERLEIPQEIHAGTCAMQGWAQGRDVTEKEYAGAVKDFRAGAGRSRHA